MNLLFCPRLAVSALLLLVITVPSAAHAQFSIKSPKVEKGEVEVEVHGSFQRGIPREEGDEGEDEEHIRHGHELEIGYGITDYWQAELGLTLQKSVGGEFEASSIELENTFELGTFQRWNMTPGLLASVSVGIGNHEPDAFEIGPLVQFGDEDTGTVILNAIFEKTFGHNREEGVGLEYAAQVRFPVSEKIGVGVEAFGEIEDIGNAPSFSETELRIGPMLYLSFGDDDDDKDGRRGDDDDGDGSLKAISRDPEIELGMGALFAATDATPDVTVKWDLEVAF